MTEGKEKSRWSLEDGNLVSENHDDAIAGNYRPFNEAASTTHLLRINTYGYHQAIVLDGLGPRSL